MFIAEWLIVAAIGAVIGIVAAFLTKGIHMPQSLDVSIGIIGALVGAALYQVTGINLFGEMTFYISGSLVSIGLLAGATLVYTLTSTDKRV